MISSLDSSVDKPSIKLSIVMPVYLPKQAIADIDLFVFSVSSILSQKIGCAQELIIINDGPDPLICLNYIRHMLRDTNIELKVVENGVNRGIVYSLNKGIALARGEYIARLDADDIWYPNKVSRQLAAMDANPDLSLTGTGMSLCDGTGRIISTHARVGGWQDAINFTLDVGTPFPHSSIVARSKIFKFLGGYSPVVKYRHIEDFELWSRWLRFFRGEYVDFIGLRYTQNPQSVSNLYGGLQILNASNLQNDLGKIPSYRSVCAFQTELGRVLGKHETEIGQYLYRVFRSSRILASPRVIDLLSQFFVDFDFVVRGSLRPRVDQPRLDISGSHLVVDKIAKLY